MAKATCDVCGQDRDCRDVEGVQVCEDCQGSLLDNVLDEYAERVEENLAALGGK